MLRIQSNKSIVSTAQVKDVCIFEADTCLQTPFSISSEGTYRLFLSPFEVWRSWNFVIYSAERKVKHCNIFKCPIQTYSLSWVFFLTHGYFRDYTWEFC